MNAKSLKRATEKTRNNKAWKRRREKITILWMNLCDLCPILSNFFSTIHSLVSTFWWRSLFVSLLNFVLISFGWHNRHMQSTRRHFFLWFVWHLVWQRFFYSFLPKFNISISCNVISHIEKAECATRVQTAWPSHGIVSSVGEQKKFVFCCCCWHSCWTDTRVHILASTT